MANVLLSVTQQCIQCKYGKNESLQSNQFTTITQVSYFHSVEFLLKTVRFTVQRFAFLSLNTHSNAAFRQHTAPVQQFTMQ